MAGARSAAAGRWCVRRYPTVWQVRYGAEILALLDDRPPGWRDVVDLARGALDAHCHPAAPSRFVAWSALLAGASWAVVALAVLLEPPAPDWPGYVSWALPPAALGTLAGLAASLGLSLRLSSPTRLTRVAVAVSAIGQTMLLVALAVAALGGPYGAMTGAAGSVAAVGLVLQGIVSVRAGRGVEGVGLTLVGGGLLLAPPLAWLVVATTWSVLGGWLTVDWSTRASGPLGPGVAS